MDKRRLIAIVDGILGNDSLCGGCQYGETKGHEEYGSCDKCRRVAADEIIEILKREDRPKGKWTPCTKTGLLLTESMRKQGEKWYGFKCSVCNHIYKGNALTQSPYCQKCGADMRGENK